ncbi:hypothetical protein LG299_14355 [Microbacterium lacus]|uniref:DUF4190 domain-containing protein n=1 Tax=Microbacterium lacus TaxID=415217 RepID=UPI00384B4EE0
MTDDRVTPDAASPAIPEASALPTHAPVEPNKPEPAIEAPSPEVSLAEEASPLPGVHRGGFSRLPTAPVPVTSASAPAEPSTEIDPAPVAVWLMPDPTPPYRGLASWALAFSVGGLIVALFVGWGFPIGIVGVVTGILAIRRPLESRTTAIWAIVLGGVSILYSAGWLLWAASRANLFG